MTSQFDDNIAKVYEDTVHMPFRRHLESTSVFAALGDVKGLSVLDLGCGTGLYTRWLKQRGAAHVIGLDISEDMVVEARNHEKRDPLGIEYVVGELPARLRGTFDLVLSVYVMPYATSRKELRDLCATASEALVSGGRFVTLPLNPDFHPDKNYYERYGFRLYTDGPRTDGTAAKLDLCFLEYQETIIAHIWTDETLDSALAETGFTSIKRVNYQASPEGIATHGEGFWRPYITCPHTVIITCENKQ